MNLRYLLAGISMPDSAEDGIPDFPGEEPVPHELLEWLWTLALECSRVVDAGARAADESTREPLRSAILEAAMLLLGDCRQGLAQPEAAGGVLVDDHLELIDTSAGLLRTLLAADGR